MNSKERDRKIQETLIEHSRLNTLAKPIKDRINDPDNPDHSLTDDEIKILVAPSIKFDEFYELICDKYPDLPVAS